MVKLMVKNQMTASRSWGKYEGYCCLVLNESGRFP